jgi:hypothetical protein
MVCVVLAGFVAFALVPLAPASRALAVPDAAPLAAAIPAGQGRLAVTLPSAKLARACAEGAWLFVPGVDYSASSLTPVAIAGCEGSELYFDAAPGTYQLRFDAWSSYCPQYYALGGNVTSRSAATPLTITADTTNAVAITSAALVRGVSASGTVNARKLGAGKHVYYMVQAIARDASYDAANAYSQLHADSVFVGGAGVSPKKTLRFKITNLAPGQEFRFQYTTFICGGNADGTDATAAEELYPQASSASKAKSLSASAGHNIKLACESTGAILANAYPWLSNTAAGIKVKWNKNPQATGYSIYRATYPGALHKLKTVSAHTTSFTDTKVKPGTVCYYYIRANKAKTPGYYTATDKTGTCRLVAPTLLKAQKGSAGVRFSWKPAAGANKYAVLRRTKNGKWKRIAALSAQKVRSGGTCVYLDSKAKRGSTYYYSVRAYFETTDVCYTKGSDDESLEAESTYDAKGVLSR